MAEIGNHPTAPTFTRNLSLNCKGIRIPSFPENGNANSISGFISGAAGPGYRAYVISDADGTTVLAQSDIRTNIGASGYYLFNGGSLAGFSLVSGTAYLICIGSDEPTSALAFFESDAEVYEGSTSGAGISDIDPLTFIAGGMAPDTTRDYAIFIDYTPAGGTTLPFVTIIGAKRI